MSLRRKITIFLTFFVGLTNIVHSQSDDLVQISENKIYLSSPFVVNPFPQPPVFGFPNDSLYQYRGLLDIPSLKPKENILIDDTWQYITITQLTKGKLLKIPFTAPLDWYFQQRIRYNSKSFILEKLPLSKKIAGQSNQQPRSRSLELVGVDLGDFGRASLRVNGNVNITGNMIYQDQELAALSYAESQRTKFDIDQKQHLNIEGTIGDRITVSMDQDSERDFDWENNIKVTYTGKEDEILQKIEAGNTSLSLPATQFVTFTGNSQGLFGVKALAKLGPIDITTIAAVERTKKATQSYSGSGQSQTQQIKDYEYVKDQYFFIHEWFRNGVSTSVNGKQIELPPYFPLDEENRHYIGNYKIVDFELYQMDQTNNPAADVGQAYIDPDNPNENVTNNKEGTFLKLERDIDYYLNVDLGYIRLKSRGQDQILAAHYKLINNTTLDTVLSVGHGLTASDSTLALKMIKAQSSHPNHPTWDLMFKNVYYLGTTNIDSSGFAVRIMNNRITPISDRDIDGTYLNQFDIDKWNENGAKIPDEKVDMDNIVFLNYGELHLPYLLPFVAESELEGGNTNENLTDKLGEGKMYTSTVYTDYTSDSRFTIEADYSNQSSTINLGFMIVEGSEKVKIDGEVQTKNEDYTIDYYTGTVNIIKSDLNPNADIVVDYEKNELVSFDKKVILGSRAQMDIGENAFIGATALYFNQSVIDEKIEVGYEPTRNFIWDINGRYSKDMDQLTYYLDKLPLIETNARSQFSVEGEFAQVLPNPNSVSNNSTGDRSGVAFIDDFEGSKRSNTPGLLMYNWKQSSAPINLETGQSYSQRNRAKLSWYNPYAKLLTNTIWPQQSTSQQSGNTTVNVLALNVDKYPYQSTVEKDSIWAGIVSPFHSGNYDQTQSKFFEIWIYGNEGKLTVDLGKISEDWNGNGVLDTEDVPVAGLAQGNGILDDSEDVGIDGVTDEYEDGWGGALDSTLGVTYQDYYSSGENILINREADINDPNSDNWEYDENNFDDYSRINGTEGNKNSTGGRYPDTEDLDRSGFLDKTNNYFTKTIPLDRSKYFVSETKYDSGEPTGWQLFRIPLSHFDKVNEVDWSEIRYIRLVWSGIETESKLYIAKIELVGNDWQELGISELHSEDFMETDSAFAVTVINTEDDADYIPPEGVKGEYNPLYDTRSKEQSLVLKFDNLPADHRGAAKKTLFALTGDRAQSYLTYDNMKMYVYGEESEWIKSDYSKVEFFMQFGLGDQYYEITQPVYSGWDEEYGRNSIDIDLDWLTKLKIQDSSSVKKINDSDVFIDSTDVKHYYFTDENGDLTGKRITIRGEPALSRIQQFIVGINNKNNEPITGEVWLDELRLSNVKKEKGTAMRVQSSLQLADLGKVSVIYSKRDADFHVLQERLGSNFTKSDLRINTSIQLQKFLPDSWGMSIPMNFSYSNSSGTPKYYPGTDIRVNQTSVPDSIIDVIESVNFSTSFSKNRKSDSKWLRYTIDNITGNFSSKRTTSSSEIIKEQINESYTGKLAYNHSFSRGNFIKPFKIFSRVPLVGEKISKINFYYTPSSFNAGINFNEKLLQKNARVGGRSADEYNLGLSRSINIDYKITDNLAIKYNTNAQSDMDSYRAQILQALQKFDPGIVTNTTESINTTFNPVIASWLKPNFNYTASYRWDKPLTSSVDGANIGTQIRLTSNVNINPSQIFDTVFKSSSKKKEVQPQNMRGRTRRTNEPKSGELKPEVEEFEIEKESREHTEPIDEINSNLKEVDSEIGGKVALKDKIQKIIKGINPINISYTSNLNRTGVGVQGDVPTGYKFGWLPYHGLQHSESVGTNLGQWNFSRNLSIRSGLKITKKANINLNYVQELNINRTTGSDLEVHSLTRDYFGYGEKMENGFPFSSWSLRITGLEKLPILKQFAKTVSLEHAFTGKENSSWKLEGLGSIPTTKFFGISDFRNIYSDYIVQSKTSSNFSPLVGLTMSIKKGISVNIRHTMSKTATRSLTGLTVQKDQAISLTSNYTHNAGFTIPIPFWKEIRVSNTMTFTINADYSHGQTLATKDDVNLTETGFTTSWKTGLRVSYSFSSRLTGAVILEYRESDSKNVGRKIDRDIGFDLNFAISG